MLARDQNKQKRSSIQAVSTCSEGQESDQSDRMSAESPVERARGATIKVGHDGGSLLQLPWYQGVSFI